MTFDLRDYLARIGLDAVEADEQGLAALQEAQLRAVTFENVDPFLGRVPDLSGPAQWRKLVEERRGGYCFELNGLFGRALAAAGFTFRPVLARVLQRAPDSARTHLAFVVRLDGQEWLADTGFGGPGAMRPLRIVMDLVQEDARGRYRFRLVEGEHLLEKESAEGDWTPLFQFDRARVSPLDIEAANIVCATWRMAPFPDNLMMARNRKDGRVSLFNRALRREAEGGAVEETRIASRGDLETALREDFALALDAKLVDAIWDRLSAG